MPEIAKSVIFDLDTKQLLVNDAEFPWYVDESGVSIHMDGLQPRVTITMLVDAAEIRPLNPALIGAPGAPLCPVCGEQLDERKRWDNNVTVGYICREHGEQTPAWRFVSERHIGPDRPDAGQAS